MKRNRTEWSKKYYSNNKEKLKEKMRKYYSKNKKLFIDYNKKRYNMGKKILHNLKINGCSICGYNKNINILEFHHINPKDKKFGINMKSIKCFSTNSMINELNKCILLCPNCHGEVTNDK